MLINLRVVNQTVPTLGGSQYVDNMCMISDIIFTIVASIRKFSHDRCFICSPFQEFLSGLLTCLSYSSHSKLKVLPSGDMPPELPQ